MQNARMDLFYFFLEASLFSPLNLPALTIGMFSWLPPASTAAAAAAATATPAAATAAPRCGTAHAAATPAAG
jgi:hypothetical protein